MRRVSRREFLRQAALGGAALGLGCVCGEALAAAGRGADAGAGPTRETEPAFTVRLADGRVQCKVCPRECVMAAGETSACHARRNHGGRLFTHAYGNPCIVSVDPVEKLPLAQFLPGTSTLTVATGGCNLRCLYCQNWQQSQAEPGSLRTIDMPPARAVEGAAKKGVPSVTFTYTDPVAFYEYALDTAVAARAQGLKAVVCTGLYIHPEPLRRLCRAADAFAVTLKGFDDAFYQKVVGDARLAPVLKGLEVLREEKVWTEVVNLVVPTYNDNLARVREMCRWLVQHLGPDVPLHFGRFVPEHRLKDLSRTPVETLERCREIGLEQGLKFVYLFNLSPHPGNNTVCPSCHKEVITRLGFRVLENHVAKGRCGFCKAALPGVWV